MIILRSENKFLDVRDKKLFQLNVLLDYPDEFISDEEEVFPYVDIKIIDENGTERDLEVDDFGFDKSLIDSDSFIFNLIEKRKTQFRFVRLSKEAKRILNILKNLNVLNQLDVKRHYSLNDKEKLDFMGSKEDREKYLNNIQQERFIENDIKIEHNYYYIDENKIALDMFGVPSSKLVNEYNARELMNKRLSKILKEKINFLDDIQVELKEKGDMNIISINGKKIDICINMNNIKNTNLKVGRINRMNVATICGSFVIKKGKKCIFIERDRNIAKQALVIVPIDKYTKRYIVNALDFKHFGFVKNCVIGFTDFENVKSLY